MKVLCVLIVVGAIGVLGGVRLTACQCSEGPYRAAMVNLVDKWADSSEALSIGGPFDSLWFVPSVVDIERFDIARGICVYSLVFDPGVDQHHRSVVVADSGRVAFFLHGSMRKGDSVAVYWLSRVSPMNTWADGDYLEISEILFKYYYRYSEGECWDMVDSIDKVDSIYVPWVKLPVVHRFDGESFAENYEYGRILDRRVEVYAFLTSGPGYKYSSVCVARIRFNSNMSVESAILSLNF